jgi:hypothetical protein
VEKLTASQYKSLSPLTVVVVDDDDDGDGDGDGDDGGDGDGILQDFRCCLRKQ